MSLITTPYTPAPQANSLPALSAVVDAVADGCVTDAAIAEALGYSGRQGAYYPNAAAELGLVEAVAGLNPREWQLTDAGATFVGLDSRGRAEFLVELLCESEWLLTYVGDPDAVRDLLAERGYSGETCERRFDCVASWSEFVFSVDADTQAREIAAAMSGTRERAPGARAAQRRGAPAVEVRRCPECFTQMALSLGTCEFCG